MAIVHDHRRSSSLGSRISWSLKLRYTRVNRRPVHTIASLHFTSPLWSRASEVLEGNNYQGDDKQQPEGVAHLPSSFTSLVGVGVLDGLCETDGDGDASGESSFAALIPKNTPMATNTATIPTMILLMLTVS